MSNVDITSMSTKGQVVIPADIRKRLKVRGGSKFIVLQEGDNILLKPIALPSMDDFQEVIALGEKIRKQINLKEADIAKEITASRKSRARSR